MTLRVRNTAARLWRLLHIGFVLLRHYPLRWLGSLVRRLPLVGARLAPPPSPAKRFRVMLEQLGGSFIKLGQVLSLQPDLIPRSYCDELFDLLDKVPPFPYRDVERAFVEDLGDTPPALFEEFERQPVASASIGQVHRARVDGRAVAVKVRRPTAVRDFGSDIGFMRAALVLVRALRIKPLLPYRVPIQEFIAWTTDELDYRTEGRYLSQVSRNSRTNSRSSVPALLAAVSTERILTAEYLEGTTLLAYLRSLERGDPAVAYRLESIGFDPATFAENIIANFLGDVFHHGIFHADLHPANLLILPNNVVGYVDFGITGMISSYGRRHVLALVQAFAKADLDEILEGILRISRVTRRSRLNRFRRGLEDLADRWFTADVAHPRLQVSYTIVMLDLLRLSRDCDLLPHEEAVRYMRSVITAEGLIGRFAPDYDVSAGMERLSGEFLRIHLAEETFSTDRVIETMQATNDLLQHGPSRLDDLLDRLQDSEPGNSPAARSATGPRRRRRGAPTARLGVLMAIVGLLFATGEPLSRFGLNLPTAEIAVLSLATVSLLWRGLTSIFTDR